MWIFLRDNLHFLTKRLVSLTFFWYLCNTKAKLKMDDYIITRTADAYLMAMEEKYSSEDASIADYKMAFSLLQRHLDEHEKTALLRERWFDRFNYLLSRKHSCFTYWVNILKNVNDIEQYFAETIYADDLVNAFMWDDTDEGVDYWAEVDEVISNDPYMIKIFKDKQ